MRSVVSYSDINEILIEEISEESWNLVSGSSDGGCADLLKALPDSPPCAAMIRLW